MPDVIILTNAFLCIGTGTASADRNFSNRLKSIAWTESFDDIDVTTMGSTTRVREIGLGDSQIKLEMMKSFSTGDQGENVDKIFNELRSISQSGSSFLVRARPYNANRTGTNPEYSMLCVMAERNVFEGNVGDALMHPVTFLSAGDLTCATATT